MSDELIITRGAPSKEPVQQQSYPTERIDLPSKGYFYAKNSYPEDTQQQKKRSILNDSL